MSQTSNPNYELEKITNSLKNQLEKLKNEADIIIRERDMSAKTLESIQAELAVKQKEEEEYLKKLRNAMSSTQSRPLQDVKPKYQQSPDKAQQDYMKIYSSKTQGGT